MSDEGNAPRRGIPFLHLLKQAAAKPGSDRLTVETESAMQRSPRFTFRRFDPVYHDWELWFYTTGFPQPQQVFEQESGIGLMKMMMDRFLSLEAPSPKDGTVEDYGYLLTKEFIWHGKRLVLNCRMRHGNSRTYGELRVEIVKRPDDANPAARMGEVVPGYSFDDCDLIRSNCPNQIVSWNKNDDISFLNGQPVYLRFRIRNGGLFSFMMEE